MNAATKTTIQLSTGVGTGIVANSIIRKKVQFPPLAPITVVGGLLGAMFLAGRNDFLTGVFVGMAGEAMTNIIVKEVPELV